MVSFNIGDRVRVTDNTRTTLEAGIEVGDTGFIESTDFMGLGLGIIVVHFDDRVLEDGTPVHQGFYAQDLELLAESTQYVQGELVEAVVLLDADILKRLGDAAQFAEETGQAYLADWLTGLGGAAMVSPEILAVVRKLIEG